MPLCFDLDGTLGTFGGGYVLLREALGELWGETPSREELMACKGSTDWEIVDELHRSRFGRPLTEATYGAYDRACRARFEAAFHPEGQRPVIFHGILQGLERLFHEGFNVWVVSGNTPSVLDFKAQSLGLSSEVPRQGSIPHHDRTALLRRVIQGHPGPHLYVGDRPHDLQAAQALGLPFLGIGSTVPGSHPSLPPEASADTVVDHVKSLLQPR